MSQASIPIAEFVGLPGSGKSTLFDLAIGYLEDCGVRVWRPAEFRRQYLESPKSGHADRFLDQSFRKVGLYGATMFRFLRPLAVAGFHLSLSARAPFWKSRALRQLFVALEIYARARTRPREGDVLLFDEGVVQKAVTLFVERTLSRKPVSNARVAQYARAIPHPDLLFFSKVEPEISRVRSLSRQSGLPPRLRDVPHADLPRILQRAGQVIEVMVRFLRQHGCVVVELDGNDLLAAGQQIRVILAEEIETEMLRAKACGTEIWS